MNIKSAASTLLELLVKDGLGNNVTGGQVSLNGNVYREYGKDTPYTHKASGADLTALINAFQVLKDNGVIPDKTHSTTFYLSDLLALAKYADISTFKQSQSLGTFLSDSRRQDLLDKGYVQSIQKQANGSVKYAYFSPVNTQASPVTTANAKYKFTNTPPQGFVDHIEKVYDQNNYQFMDSTGQWYEYSHLGSLLLLDSANKPIASKVSTPSSTTKEVYTYTEFETVKEGMGKDKLAAYSRWIDTQIEELVKRGVIPSNDSDRTNAQKNISSIISSYPYAKLAQDSYKFMSEPSSVDGYRKINTESELKQYGLSSSLLNPTDTKVKFTLTKDALVATVNGITQKVSLASLPENLRKVLLVPATIASGVLDFDWTFGFNATLYQNTDPNNKELVLGFKGTSGAAYDGNAFSSKLLDYGDQFADWVMNNLPQAFGLNSDYYTQAKKIADSLSKQKNLTYVGHLEGTPYTRQVL